MDPRGPIFAAVRAAARPGVFGDPGNILALDNLLDAFGVPRASSGHKLGKLSEKYESGGRGPGTVSSGKGDPGGVSYGLYQLASKTGTAAAFIKADGAPWRKELSAAPGTAAFSAAWKAIAAREPAAFGSAQHAFIKRTHYDPAIAAVKRASGIDLDARHAAVRDAVWSVAVQHGGAAKILTEAIRKPGALASDRALVNAIYDVRSEYVRRLSLPANTRNSLIARYRSERADALKMLED